MEEPLSNNMEELLKDLATNPPEFVKSMVKKHRADFHRTKNMADELLMKLWERVDELQRKREADRLLRKVTRCTPK